MGGLTITSGIDIYVGCSWGPNNCFDEWLDDLRITKGVGIYSGSYTVLFTNYAW